MTELELMGEKAVVASREAAKLKINDKNNALTKIAQAVIDNTDAIIKANAIDMEAGEKAGIELPKQEEQIRTNFIR